MNDWTAGPYMVRSETFWTVFFRSVPRSRIWSGPWYKNSVQSYIVRSDINWSNPILIDPIRGPWFSGPISFRPKSQTRGLTQTVWDPRTNSDRYSYLVWFEHPCSDGVFKNYTNVRLLKIANFHVNRYQLYSEYLKLIYFNGNEFKEWEFRIFFGRELSAGYLFIGGQKGGSMFGLIQQPSTGWRNSRRLNLNSAEGFYTLAKILPQPSFVPSPLFGWITH